MTPAQFNLLFNFYPHRRELLLDAASGDRRARFLCAGLLAKARRERP